MLQSFYNDLLLSESKVLGNWTGFSTNLYANLFSRPAASATSLTRAVYNTVIIALISAFVSMILVLSLPSVFLTCAAATKRDALPQ